MSSAQISIGIVLVRLQQPGRRESQAAVDGCALKDVVAPSRAYQNDRTVAVRVAEWLQQTTRPLSCGGTQGLTAQKEASGCDPWRRLLQVGQSPSNLPRSGPVAWMRSSSVVLDRLSRLDHHVSFRWPRPCFGKLLCALPEELRPSRPPFRLSPQGYT